jgi:hypothetical protein
METMLWEILKTIALPLIGVIWLILRSERRDDMARMKAMEDRQVIQEEKQAAKCAIHSKAMVEQVNTDTEIALEAITARLDMLENHSEGANTKMSDHDVRIAKLEIQISIELRNINEKLDRLMAGR